MTARELDLGNGSTGAANATRPERAGHDITSSGTGVSILGSATETCPRRRDLQLDHRNPGPRSSLDERPERPWAPSSIYGVGSERQFGQPTFTRASTLHGGTVSLTGSFAATANACALPRGAPARDLQ